MDERLEVAVSGRVQGVGFRWFVQREGCFLGLGGWVKNLPNGDVAVVAEGPRHKLEKFLRSVRLGPSLSRVDDVSIRWLPECEGLVDFRVAY